MKNLCLAPLALLLSLAACKSSPGTSDPQSIVDAMAQKHSDCTRLTLHCMQSQGSAMVCASTLRSRVGTPSDPEDLQAMQSGETVVLEEGDDLDVTVPIIVTDGKCTTVCGVTLHKGDASRAATIARAEGIAMAVKGALGNCCPNPSVGSGR